MGLRYTAAVLANLSELLAFIEPHALLLALALPPVIRVVGHWIPEELFMVVMGVLAARQPGLQGAALLLGAVILSHFVTDQILFVAGRWLRPRLSRFPRIAARLEMVSNRLQSSPGALFGFIPARVLPLGRGAWLAGCGVVGIPWTRFAAVDLLALAIHTATWSGLGWWFSNDLARLAASTDVGKIVGGWLAIMLVTGFGLFILWRTRPSWQPASARVMRRITGR